MIFPAPMMRRAIGILVLVSYMATQCVFAHVPAVSAFGQRAQTKMSPVTSSPLRSLHPNLLSTVPTPLPMPLSYGHVVSIKNPSGVSRGVVIHIQDVHRHSEAQQNISAAIRELTKNNQVSLLALEGAQGAIDVSAFHSFPDFKTVGNVADELLSRKMMTGAAHAAMLSQVTSVPVVGIDDDRLHQLNIDAYRRSVEVKKTVAHKINLFAEQLHEQKRRTFNSDLYQFDLHVNAFEAGDRTLSEHVDALLSYSSVVPLSVQKFALASQLQSKLDVKAVGEDQARLLPALMGGLPAESQHALSAQAQQVNLGHMSRAVFYEQLQNLSNRMGVDWSLYPALRDYCDYLALSSSLDSETLLSDVSNVERHMYDRFVRSASERRLIRLGRRVALMKKLIRFELSPSEWGEYRSNGYRMAAELRPFEMFYLCAKLRDEKMTTNFLDAWAAALPPKSSASAAILVTGGFHSAGIDQRLFAAGYTVIVFSPKITKIDSASISDYLAVFRQRTTPLQQLFSGEQSFLGENPFSLESVRYAALLTSALALVRKSVSTDSIRSWLASFFNWRAVQISVDSRGQVVISNGADREYHVRLSNNTEEFSRHSIERSIQLGDQLKRMGENVLRLFTWSLVFIDAGWIVSQLMIVVGQVDTSMLFQFTTRVSSVPMWAWGAAVVIVGGVATRQRRVARLIHHFSNEIENKSLLINGELYTRVPLNDVMTYPNVSKFSKYLKMSAGRDVEFHYPLASIRDLENEDWRFFSDASFAVLDSQNNICGIICGRLPKDSVVSAAWADTFSIDEKLRGTGVAQWMFYHMARALQRKHKTNVQWTHYPSMLAAERLYKSFGATVHPENDINRWTLSLLSSDKTLERIQAEFVMKRAGLHRFGSVGDREFLKMFYWGAGAWREFWARHPGGTITSLFRLIGLYSVLSSVPLIVYRTMDLLMRSYSVNPVVAASTSLCVFLYASVAYSVFLMQSFRNPSGHLSKSTKIGFFPIYAMLFFAHELFNVVFWFAPLQEEYEEEDQATPIDPNDEFQRELGLGPTESTFLKEQLRKLNLPPTIAGLISITPEQYLARIMAIYHRTYSGAPLKTQKFIWKLQIRLLARSRIQWGSFAGMDASSHLLSNFFPGKIITAMIKKRRISRPTFAHFRSMTYAELMKLGRYSDELVGEANAALILAGQQPQDGLPPLMARHFGRDVPDALVEEQPVEELLGPQRAELAYRYALELANPVLARARHVRIDEWEKLFDFQKRYGRSQSGEDPIGWNRAEIELIEQIQRLEAKRAADFLVTPRSENLPLMARMLLMVLIDSSRDIEPDDYYPIRDVTDNDIEGIQRRSKSRDSFYSACFRRAFLLSAKNSRILPMFVSDPNRENFDSLLPLHDAIRAVEKCVFAEKLSRDPNFKVILSDFKLNSGSLFQNSSYRLIGAILFELPVFLALAKWLTPSVVLGVWVVPVMAALLSMAAHIVIWQWLYKRGAEAWRSPSVWMVSVGAGVVAALAVVWGWSSAAFYAGYVLHSLMHAIINVSAHFEHVTSADQNLSGNESTRRQFWKAAAAGMVASVWPWRSALSFQGKPSSNGFDAFIPAIDNKPRFQKNRALDLDTLNSIIDQWRKLKAAGEFSKEDNRMQLLYQFDSDETLNTLYVVAYRGRLIFMQGEQHDTDRARYVGKLLKDLMGMHSQDFMLLREFAHGEFLLEDYENVPSSLVHWIALEDTAVKKGIPFVKTPGMLNPQVLSVLKEMKNFSEKQLLLAFFFWRFGEVVSNSLRTKTPFVDDMVYQTIAHTIETVYGFYSEEKAELLLDLILALKEDDVEKVRRDISGVYSACIKIANEQTWHEFEFLLKSDREFIVWNTGKAHTPMYWSDSWVSSLMVANTMRPLLQRQKNLNQLSLLKVIRGKQFDSMLHWARPLVKYLISAVVFVVTGFFIRRRSQPNEKESPRPRPARSLFRWYTAVDLRAVSSSS